MKRYTSYLFGIVQHKWHVFWACLQMGCSFWTALVHDMSKFMPIEFFAYARKFRNEDGSPKKFRDNDGSYNPNWDIDFAQAWIHHQRNKHHWQAWVSIGDYGELMVVPMPKKYIREMIGDWIGAGISYSGIADPIEWYQKTKDKMVLHNKTTPLIETLLNELEEAD